MGEKAINWVNRVPDSAPIYPGRRSYRDPTADAAIGHVLAEQRKKKRQQKSSHPKTRVWRAKGTRHA